MSKYNDSSAVQYERFPVERVQYQERPELEVLSQQKTAARSKKAAFPYGKYAVIFSCVFAVLFCIVASYMRLAEIHTQNAKLEKEIAALESDENALNAKKEQMYNLAHVEEYAQDKLGMVKADKSQITYVELDAGDKMVLAGAASAQDQAQESAGLLSRLLRSFSIVVEYLN